MRIAIISDVHGNLSALDAVLDDIERRNVDEVVNLGDCLSGPLDAAGTAERLMSLGLRTVRGNHDRQLYDRPVEKMGSWERWIIDDLSPVQIDWLKRFPLTDEVGGLFLCHATPEKDDENWLDRRGPENRLVARDLDGVTARVGGVTAQVIACGHTHVPRAVKVPGGPVIVNPGAVGCPAYLDDRAEPPFVMQSGSADAQYAIIEKRLKGWLTELLSVPYDSAAMAALAREKGAESWAHALETGWWS